MSTLTLRHYPLTLSWSARQKDEQADERLEKAIRRVCVRINRRKIKQALRSLVAKMES